MSSCQDLLAFATDLQIPEMNIGNNCCNRNLQYSMGSLTVGCIETEIKALYISTINERPIPTSLKRLNGLLDLMLTGNWTGSIPKEIGELTQLQTLTIHETKLESSLPVDLSRVPMVKLELFNNPKLVGQIPPEYGNWTRLAKIGITNTPISGPAPKEWTNQFLPFCVVDKASCKQITGLPSSCQQECNRVKSDAKTISSFWNSFIYFLAIL